MSTSECNRRRTVALVGLLSTTGGLHFLQPKLFRPLIPGWLPGTANRWVLGSGAAELACAAATACPRTRRAGATASALLFGAVWPGNLTMAVNYRRTEQPTWKQALAWARLPLQWPLITLAWRLRHATARGL